MFSGVTIFHLSTKYFCFSVAAVTKMTWELRIGMGLSTVWIMNWRLWTWRINWKHSVEYLIGIRTTLWLMPSLLSLYSYTHSKFRVPNSVWSIFSQHSRKGGNGAHARLNNIREWTNYLINNSDCTHTQSKFIKLLLITFSVLVLASQKI